jgi:ATP-dependent protease HslVU (ClpYQ) ATPase subunit
MTPPATMQDAVKEAARKARRDPWTDEQNAILMDGLAEGVGFTEIGRRLGKTKHTCISRFKKIAAAMGEQAQ